ncbi:hypothetical protein OnM2_033024 [Erysiphe neolycopersici]|uniref:Uncharacterized protein n=1 Tax=Erysiphe neolycopersici TaxID=212602 RepID=A0A420HYH2_9PEZI|nr:hypothetical protein OnM2_033024 [Erysiphe neolycopersici]
MAQISSRPLDRQFIPKPKESLQLELNTTVVASAPVFDDPIVSVNAATAQMQLFKTSFFRCGTFDEFLWVFRRHRNIGRPSSRSSDVYLVTAAFN